MTLVDGSSRTDDSQVRAETARSSYAELLREVEQAPIVAMRTFFAPPFNSVPVDLYARIAEGAATRHRVAATVHAHSRITTGTYFGRFPASYWQRWTSVAEVEVVATTTGSGELKVMASDHTGEVRVVAAERAERSHDTELRLCVSLTEFADGGAVWIEVETQDAPFHVRDVHWLVPRGH